MADRPPSTWLTDVASRGADSIADQLSSRMEASPALPGDALDWAAIAAGYEREAAAIGDDPRAASVLFEAGRIFEERLGDGAAGLALYRRAFARDPALVPNLQSARRAALEVGDDGLAADVLAAEERTAADPAERAALLALRARVLRRLGRAAEARADSARAWELDPACFAAAEELALDAAASGDRATLVEAYLRCGAAADRTLEAQYVAAAAALLDGPAGDPARAGELALRAFALDPRDGAIRALARRHAERLGNDDALRAILRGDAERSAGAAAANAWCALARIEERQGRHEAAVAALEQARAAAPSDPSPVAELARLCEERGDWEAAAAAQRAVADAHRVRSDPARLPDAVGALLRCAELEDERLDRPAEAARTCRAALALVPAHRGALAALGRASARAGDWQGVVDAFLGESEATRDRAERAQKLYKAAEALDERLAQPARAVERLTEALALDPDHVPAREALERLHAREGQWTELIALLERDVEDMADPPGRAALLLRIARICEERLGDPARSAELYRRALAEDPQSRVALPALAAVLARLGRWEEVLEVQAREATLASDPRRKLALLQRNAEIVEERIGDAERGRAAWEEVRARAPRHLPALRALGRLHAAAGRWEEVAALHRAEADGSEDNDAAADHLFRSGAILEKRLARLDDALAAYREVLTLAPAHLPALDALARIARARGDAEALVDALRALAAARAAPEERAATLAEAARVWEERLGNRAAAVECHEEALRVSPGFAPAIDALARLYVSLGRVDALEALRRDAATGATAAERPARLVEWARLEADRAGASGAAREALEALEAAAPGHPAAALLRLRLAAADPAERARARTALGVAASSPVSSAALLAAAAIDAPGPRADGLARAAALDPASAALAPEAEHALRSAGGGSGLARFCEARRARAWDAPSRAHWAVLAGEAWARAGEDDRALAAFQSALSADPSCLPAVRAVRALLARRGDWAAVRGSLHAEGAALRDPQGAAAAYLEAGEIAEQYFADLDAACHDYRAAAERDPRDPTPLARLEAILGADGREQIRVVREAHARAETDPGRAAEAWLEVASAAREVGNLPAALEALDQALQAHPDQPAALVLRGRLRAEAGRAAEALADTEAALALDARGAAIGPLLPLHLSAAALAEEVGQPDRARGHLEAAVALQPTADALARLARLHRSAARWREASAALQRLLALPGLPPSEAARHLLDLADAESHGGDPVLAAACCRRALELAPAHPDALALLVRLEQARGDPRAVAAALESVAEASPEARTRAAARLEAARLHAGALRDHPRAVDQLRRALEDDPTLAEARGLLARELEESAPAKAVEEHRRILTSDPLEVASWSALYRIFERSRAHDRAHVAGMVLRWLGTPLPGAADRLQAEADGQAFAAPPLLAPEDWELVRDPADRGALADLVAAAGDAVAAALRPSAGGRREPLDRDHPLRRALDELARAFGAEDYEVHLGLPGAVTVEAGTPPVVLLGADLLRRWPREQRFLLGRAAARLRSRSAVAEALAGELLADGLGAAVRQVLPDHGVLGHPSEALVRRVSHRLSRRARRQLEPAARALAAAASPPDVEAWRAAAAATAARAGLVLCGDVSTALAVMLREGAPGGRAPAGADAVAAARSRPDVLALLAFAATEEHLVLRQRWRVAIA
ncbi:MAG TPA: tetratricopeptide repeat protein [Anaeromyxobacteraceae bacterium]|nr:tetratricopeptide repeat protein [Anaeromyxobacteraceae bacterium]